MSTRILIIDDEQDLCHLLKIILLKDKFLIDCAYSLTDAGQKLLLQPQIIFLDNNLPDGTGLDFLKQNPHAFRKSCVTMISADARPEIKKDALQEGIRVFLQKPFAVGAIRSAIQSIP